MTEDSSQQKRVAWSVLACFVAAAIVGAGLPVVYWVNGDTAIEGACLGACFLLLAAGLVIWSHHLVPEGPYMEDYPEHQSTPAQEAGVLATLDRGGVGRRRLLLGSLGVAGLSLVAGGVSTLRSLGPAPNTLASTAWKERLLLVDSDGRPLHVGDLPIGGEITVFPEGHIEDPMVPAMLIHLPPGANHPLPGRAAWAPRNLICYSKVCSHAGCPVNLYDDQTMKMECPCHQSTFAVTEGARPVFGPAAGSLAQLPLHVEPDGTLRSAGDFSQPPGPVFWHYSKSAAE